MASNRDIKRVFGIRPKIRRVLKHYSDGLTASQVAQILNEPSTGVQYALKGMTDVWIDRWTYDPPNSKQLRAVYCVAPDNCPKPERKPNDGGK